MDHNQQELEVKYFTQKSIFGNKREYKAKNKLAEFDLISGEILKKLPHNKTIIKLTTSDKYCIQIEICTQNVESTRSDYDVQSRQTTCNIKTSTKKSVWMSMNYVNRIGN